MNVARAHARARHGVEALGARRYRTGCDANAPTRLCEPADIFPDLELDSGALLVAWPPSTEPAGIVD